MIYEILSWALCFAVGVLVGFLVYSLARMASKGEDAMPKPWNNHNHYRGEQLHDDGYFGPEPVIVCAWCKDAEGEKREVNGAFVIDDPVCDACWEDFLKDHPQYREHDEDDWRKER